MRQEKKSAKNTLPKEKKYILEITPQTHIRSTAGDRILFRIPRNKLKESGLRRLERIEKYNKYKADIYLLAKAQKFTFPAIGASIKFYIPIPKSWTKSKRNNMHLQYHMNRSDLDNLCKALFDSLMSEDKHIAHFEAAKFWVDAPSGWIEITDTFKEARIK